MTVLLDHQLPPALKVFFAEKGVEAIHVSDVGMQSQTDRAVWAFAKSKDMQIVSKDEDFLFLAAQDPLGPRLIWVRLGNCSNVALVEAFARLWPRLEIWMNSGDRVVEIR